MNGVYFFQTVNKDWWLEEFINGRPTGKFGESPNYDSPIIRFSLKD
jgi:hypothetical protein